MNLLASRSLQISLLGLSLALAGCAQHAPLQAKSACDNGELMSQTTLYFGLSRSNGPNITQAQWKHFVDQDVTPRFREGLTVFKGQGQWLGHNGKIAKEGSRALMLIYPLHDQNSEAKIEALRSIYKKQFDQESVMRIDAKKCVSF